MTPCPILRGRQRANVVVPIAPRYTDRPWWLNLLREMGYGYPSQPIACEPAGGRRISSHLDLSPKGVYSGSKSTISSRGAFKHEVVFAEHGVAGRRWRRLCPGQESGPAAVHDHDPGSERWRRPAGQVFLQQRALRHVAED